jgi:hypothetical protein
MSDPLARLPTRPLPRAEIECPPIVWRVTSAVMDPGVLGRCLEIGADVFIADCDAGQVEAAAGKWIIGIDADTAAAMDVDDTSAQLRSRSATVVGVLLQHAESGQIKSGRAVDRIMRLRDALGARLLAIEAADTGMAEWLVDHSPAHAVLLPYDLADQSAGWRLLDSASELGVGLFARRSEPPIPWIDAAPADERSLGFVAADRRIACVVVDLTTSIASLDSLVSAVRSPMSPEDSAEWIARYRALHPAPARRRHGHAPDEM